MTDGEEHVASAEVRIDATPERVWQVLTEPGEVAGWMQGSRVETDWAEGSPITWSGEFDGKAYQDKGEVLEVVECARLRVTHFSPLMGQDDVPENYHTLDYRLSADGEATTLHLDQDGNDSAEQAEQFSSNWQQMLEGLKQQAEGS